MIAHLFNSVVRVEEMQYTVEEGVPTITWAQATHPDQDLNAMLAYMPVRLDLNFIRPGKDIPQAVVAGRAPDRIGVLFALPHAPLKAGQRVVTIPGDTGQEPVKGVFEVRVVPDMAIDYSSAHHIEVQVVETTQQLTGIWPEDDPEVVLPSPGLPLEVIIP